MIILGFDSAVKKLGVCCVRFDDQWLSKIEGQIDKVRSFEKLTNEISTMTKKELLGHLYDVFKSVSDFADGILQIEYVNVFDLIVDTAKKDVNALEKTQRLKCMLAHLDNILPKPDVVLIEYQMVQNDTSRSISNQIMYHYCDHVDFKMGHKSGDIGYALKDIHLNL